MPLDIPKLTPATTVPAALRPDSVFGTPIDLDAIKAPGVAALQALKPALLVFMLSVLFFALTMDRFIVPYDEGLILTGAMRVAAGDMPHRDFYVAYGPGQFYLLASLFKVFGQTVMVERVLDVLIRGATVALVFWGVAAYCRNTLAWMAAVITALWLFAAKMYGYPIYAAIPLSIGSSLLLVSVLNGATAQRRLFLAGMLSGLVALFRYDVGFYTVVAHTFILGAAAVVDRGRPGSSVAETARRWVVYMLGVALVFLPVAADFLSQAPLAPFIHDIVSYPLHFYAQNRKLPFPGVDDIARMPETSMVYLPLAICALSIASLWVQRATRRAGSAARGRGTAGERDPRWFLALFALLSAIFYLKGLVRVAPLQMMLSFVPATMLLAVLTERAFASRGALRALVVVALSWTFVATLYASLREVQRMALAHTAVTVDHLAADIPGISSAHAFTDRQPPGVMPRTAPFAVGNERAEGLQYIVENTRPDERIFIGVMRTDKVFANDNAGYFAAGRMPASRWYQYDPGLQSRADIQADIVRELDAQQVRYIMLTSEFDDKMEPNESSKSSGVHLLDDYVRSHYRVVKSYGEITVLLRDNGAAERNATPAAVPAPAPVNEPAPNAVSAPNATVAPNAAAPTKAATSALPARIALR